MVNKRLQRKPAANHPWKKGPACDTKRAHETYREIRRMKEEGRKAD